MDLEDLGERMGQWRANKPDWKCKICLWCCCFVSVGFLVFIIIILASIHTLGPEDQVVMNTPTDKRTIDGPTTRVLDPFRGKEYRKATRMGPREYAVVRDMRDGTVRHEMGPILFFPGPWEDIDRVELAIVLQKQEYIRLVDRWTGVERIVPGPETFVPEPLEFSPEGKQKAIIIGAGLSVLTLNATTGVKDLIIEEGVFTPGPYQEILEVRSPIVIDQMQYAVLRNIRDGEVRHVEGPAQVQVGAYEEFMSIHEKIVLQNDEYIRFVDQMTGLERVARGPDTIVPGPAEVSEVGVQQSVHVGAETAVLIENHTSGLKSLVTEEGVYAPGPYITLLETRYAHIVGPYDYATIRNLQTGALETREGPVQIRVDAYEELLSIQPKVVLQFDEFIRLIDQQDGTERVEQGPQTFIPLPSEVAPHGVEEAFFVTHESKLLVLNRTTGDRRLVHDQGLFMPDAYEDILEQRHIIRVMPSEAVIVRNGEGDIQVMSGMDGDGVGISFFLDPYDEVVTMTWTDYSTAGTVGAKEVSRIDLRRSKMYFQYTVRTKDQVVLSLEGTIFWRIVDVSDMIRTSQDPEGDVWYHARSTFIGEVSKVTLEQFMDNFNAITQGAFDASSGDTFYSDRGVEIDTMEVTKYDTVDEETSDILMEIIRETTRRINLEGEQETEALLAMTDLEAEIYLESNRTQLLNIQKGNQELRAELEGKALGLYDLSEVQTIIDGMENSVSSVDDRVEIYKMKESNKRTELDTQNYAKMDLHLAPEEMTLLLGSHARQEL